MEIREHIPPEIPGYNVHKFLGKGGQTEVWEAFNEATKRKVALKIATLDGRDAKEKAVLLRAEGAVLQSLTHPNIVKCYNPDIRLRTEFDELQILELELIEGVDSQEFEWNRDNLWQLLCQMVSVLQHLKDHKIVHRDIKPNNIMVKQVRNKIAIRLIDFGICCGIGECVARGDGLTGGTETLDDQGGFVPPEALYNGSEHIIASADDVWALGVTLSFLMTKRFRALDLPTEEIPRWGEQLVNSVNGMLERDPKKRMTVDSLRALTEVGRVTFSPGAGCRAMLKEAHAGIGQELDLCFVLDATGSMQKWVDGVRDKVAALSSEVLSGHHKVDARWSAICYRDPVDVPGEKHERCDFVAKPADLSCFLKKIQADGGGDDSEDWVGAAREVLKLPWRPKAKRAVVWIADAGAHGARFGSPGEHDAEGDLFEPEVEKMAAQRIRVVALHVTTHSLATFEAMKKIYVKHGFGERFEIFAYSPVRTAGESEVAHISKTIMTMGSSAMKRVLSG